MTGPIAAVPATPGELTPAWLAAVLGEPVDPGVPLDLEPIGVGYGLTAVIHRCRWTAPDGGTRSVVVKLWNTDSVAGTREVDFYRGFGAAAGLRIPACFHAAVDEATRRGVLVLEDLGEVIQGDCLEQLPLEPAMILARGMASLHGNWWKHDSLACAPWLPDVTRLERPPGWFENRRGRFLERFPDRLDPFSRSLVDRAEALHDRANLLLAAAPSTLLHADVHLDNVVFEGPERRPVVLDWARVARGPAALDLVWVLFEITRLKDVDRVLDAYLEALEQAGWHQDEAAWRRQLGGALLRRFISGTCGVARWEPASEREAAMIETGLGRAMDAVHLWREKAPELFAA